MLIKIGKSNETEEEKAKRIFKFYKGTNSKQFPPDIPLLECYDLLSKYYPFMSDKPTKQTINTLTSICNMLDKEKIILIYGDVKLDALKSGIQKFFIHNKKQIVFRFIDCAIIPNIKDYFKNSLTIRSHIDEYIIYIIDNIHLIKIESVFYLEKQKEDLYGHDKAIICCTQYLKKVDVLLRNQLRSIKGGMVYKSETNYEKVIKCLIKYTNKEKSLEYLSNLKVSVQFIIRLLSYNMRVFFNGIEFIKNTELVNEVSKYIFKTKPEYIYTVLVHGLHKSKIKRNIKFPPRKINFKKLIKEHKKKKKK